MANRDLPNARVRSLTLLGSTTSLATIRSIVVNWSSCVWYICGLMDVMHEFYLRIKFDKIL